MLDTLLKLMKACIPGTANELSDEEAFEHITVYQPISQFVLRDSQIVS